MIPALAFFGLLVSGADPEPPVQCFPPRQVTEWTAWGMVITTWEQECTTRSARGGKP
jgi:hypothetical protein